MPGSAQSFCASSPGPSQQSAWALLNLPLCSQEGSSTCSGALLDGVVQGQQPHWDRGEPALPFSSSLLQLPPVRDTGSRFLGPLAF